MVGTRADIRKGVWLGITVAVTHTAGIFILGAATLAFTALVVPERIVSWLSIATGLLIIALGGVLVWRSRVLTTSPSAAPPIHNRSKRNSKKAGRGHTHGQGQAHSHGPADHDHGHPTTPDLRHRDVAMLGIVGGLVPSGSALLLLLSAVALNQVAYGLLLIVAFGVGMALVLTGMSTGVAILRRTPALSWESWRNSRVRSVAVWLPTISGLIVVGLGVWLTADAIRNFV
jgi:ABC-type nickel/cobalt efflux system permease component RcnA